MIGGNEGASVQPGPFPHRRIAPGSPKNPCYGSGMLSSDRLSSRRRPLRFVRTRAFLVSILVVAWTLVACSVPASSNAGGRLLGAQVSAQSEPPLTVDVRPGDDIQAVIDAHPPGTGYLLLEGVHRMQTFTPSTGDVIAAMDGAVLSGARVLQDFRREGLLWVIDGQTQEGEVAERIAYNGQDLCVEQSTGVETPRCHRPEALYIDDRRLLHVARLDDVRPGTWFLDYEADRIYLGDDPTGATVEAAVTPQAIDADGAESVTLRNVVVEKYASPLSTAAVQTGLGWLVDGGVIRHNSAVGVRMRDRGVLRGTRVYGNGQLGVGAIGTDIEIVGTEIHDNGNGGFSTFLVAGGTKFLYTSGLVVRDSYVHGNAGPGLSADYNNIDVLYENNRIVGNGGPGIHHEASYDAVFRNNVVENNGHVRTRWVLGAGIFVNSSPNVTIEGNYLRGNYQGVIGVQVQRSGSSTGEYGPHELASLRVRGNTIEMPRGQSGIAVAGTIEQPERFFAAASFEGNVYLLGDQLHPFRLGQSLTVEEWRSFGQDLASSISYLP